MFCPLHRLPCLHGQDEQCLTCQQQGLTVITCELDKVSRTIDTLTEQDIEIDFQKSHAVIVCTNTSNQCNFSTDKELKESLQEEPSPISSLAHTILFVFIFTALIMALTILARPW